MDKPLIIVLGAGRSSWGFFQFIDAYLHKMAKVKVVDRSAEQLLRLQESYPYMHTSTSDLNPEALDELCTEAALVVSLLPPSFHEEVAKACLKNAAHLVTASYATEAIKGLSAKAKEEGLYMVMEAGFDPGLDHALTDRLLAEMGIQASQVRALYSYCGGLPAQAEVSGGWGYQLFWNPYNVVHAGKAGAKWLEKGQEKRSAYPALFQATRRIQVGGAPFEVYANRNSILYKQIYGLGNAENIMRGTIRYPGFAEAWHGLAEAGLTAEGTWDRTEASPEAVWAQYFSQVDWQALPPDLQKKWAYLGFPHSTKKYRGHSPAEWLMELILDRWQPDTSDKDRILVQIEVTALGEDGKTKKGKLELDYTQNTSIRAMSMLVGYPLGIAVESILKNELGQPGLLVPIHNALSKRMAEVPERLNIPLRFTVE